jgi:UDP-N-acetylglucosamine 2-epimerase (non-hydrolysing)
VKKILLIVGTRPEAIKMAPVYHAFRQAGDAFETRLCLTGQHMELVEEVLDFFNIQADFRLDVMKESRGDLNRLTTLLLEKVKTVLDAWHPDCVLVQGDTTSAFAAGLAAFYAGIKIGHIEAGLRTFDKLNPFPEEFNRSALSRLADFHFAPTEQAKQQLLNEKIPEENILVCGNTVVDALREGKMRLKGEPLPFDQIGTKMLLTTLHRRENQGQVFKGFCEALLSLSKREGWLIVYPVHPNPNLHALAQQMLGNQPNIKLLGPQPYGRFIQLLLRADLILTDSGGIQEEATVLGKPVLLVRNLTERQEAVSAGIVSLVGNGKDNIVAAGHQWMEKTSIGHFENKAVSPYDRGGSSGLILSFLKQHLL